MREIHIEVVENGFVCRPESYLRDQATTRVEEIYVFHTLIEVHAWLTESLEKPKEPYEVKQ